MRRFFVLFFLLAFPFSASATDELSALGFSFRLITWDQSRPPIVLLGERLPYAEGHHALRFSRSLRSVLTELQNRDGAIVVDCTLFAQIAVHILAERLDDSVFVLDPQGGTMALVVAQMMDRELVYLTIKDPKTVSQLQRTNLINKGQWLLPVAEDRYLGLSSDGPLVASEAQWTARLKKALVAEIGVGGVGSGRLPIEESCEAALGLRWVSVDLGRILYEQGKLEEWEIKQFPLP